MTQGRHCIGRPGLGRRDITMIVAAAGIFAAAAVLAVLAMLAVSGWYTASGATAVVQMLAR